MDQVVDTETAKEFMTETLESVGVEELAQRLPLDELQHQVAPVGVLFHAVDASHVRVVQ